MSSRLVTCSDAAALAALAASHLGAVIERAIDTRGRARVALSGGSTPAATYRTLAARKLPWSQVQWFFVDERCVPPSSPRSNHAAAVRDLFGPASIAPGSVFRMQGEDPDPTRAARDYEAELCRAFELGREEALRLDAHARSPLRFDLLVAGVGADGHTASLFPGTGAVARTDALVTVVHPGGDLESRLTLTRPVLVAARAIAILCSGSDKRDAVENARRPGDEEQVPTRLYLAAEPGSVTWFLDAAARGETASVTEPERSR